MRLVRVAPDDMADIYAAMQQNFMSDELRGFGQACALLKDDRYNLYHIVNNGERAGFIAIWELGGRAFIEHFAIREEYRGKGLGGSVIDLVCGKAGRVLLEVERPSDSITKRRVAFYARHGFALNPQDYVQPAYRPEGSSVPMRLMSYPAPLDDYEATVSLVYEAVYGVKYLPGGGIAQL